MFDDVEGRRFLVEPAGKDALPASLRVSDVELDERAGQLLHLPCRGRLARPQSHDRVADPDRLARLQRQLARDAVALVEQAEDGDALGHRSRPRRDGGDGLRNIDRLRLSRRLRVRRLLARAAAAARREHQGEEGDAGPEVHAWSGVQAS
jgi:hypothetical protein